MESTLDHITVCICTYKRPQMLSHLLDMLIKQATDNAFTYSIVIVDNDYTESAKSTVMSFKELSSIDMAYYCEPVQNIALARNKAVQNARGNFVAFIDDDEFPDPNWLLYLFRTFKQYGADGVLGPVKPHFETEPPKWIIKGNICERKSFITGEIIKKSSDTRTGNVLLGRNIFDVNESPFNHIFGKTGGEDVDFFMRMLKKGFIFIWCDEAVVYETVPPERFTRSYYLKRALQRGAVNSKKTSLFTLDIFKSLIAFLLYTATLPFLLLMGQHIFMQYLIKDCDHIGKLLGVFKFNFPSNR